MSQRNRSAARQKVKLSSDLQQFIPSLPAAFSGIEMEKSLGPLCEEALVPTCSRCEANLSLAAT